MTTLVDYLEDELHRRNWRPADLARAAGVPDATISHILNGSRRAGPDVCNAIARALGEPPERIFRLAGLLPGQGGLRRCRLTAPGRGVGTARDRKSVV